MKISLIISGTQFIYSKQLKYSVNILLNHNITFIILNFNKIQHKLYLLIKNKYNKK